MRLQKTDPDFAEGLEPWHAVDVQRADLGSITKPLNRKTLEVWGVSGLIVNPRKLEHGFRMNSAGIPYTLP